MATTAVNAAEVMLGIERAYIGPAMHEFHEDGIPRSMKWPFAQKFTIPAAQLASGKLTRLFQFPAGAYIWGWRSTPTDLDTDATPAVVYSIVTTDDDDNVKVTLVASSTNGQAAAGSDSLAAAAYGRYVGNQWCVFSIGTAADVGAAGTLKCAWELSIGAINRSKRGVLLTDAEV